MKKILLVGIVLLGFWLRTMGLGADSASQWDAGTHINPDERFLTMVLSAMEWPGWENYFRTSVSTLNPVNVGYGFFVYGTLPLFINKITAGILGMGSYDGYLIVGRWLSAIFDTGTVLVVFFIAKKLARDLTGMVAAFFYAVAVIPIQNAHFFVVDPFGNFFAGLTLIVLVSLVSNPSIKKGVGLGLSMGAALACKLSLVLIFPAVAAGFAILAFKTKNFVKTIIIGLSFLVFVFATFRVAMPYAFDDFSLTKFEKRFRNNSETVSKMVQGKIDMPPSVQWTGTNFIWPVQEVALWGWGLPVGVLVAFSLGYVALKSIYEKDSGLIILLVALIVPFAYQANLLAKAQRYFLSSYIVLPILLAIFLTSKRLRFLFVLSGLLSLSWAVAFTRIYRVPHPRVAASRWIYQAIPPGSKIGWEHWDDPLPLLVDNHSGGEYPGVQFSLYDEENVQKKQKLVADLAQSDYVVLSSNRLYGSIPKRPNQYPLAIRYYKLLFEEKLGFKKVAEFTSYPGVGNLRVNDDQAEEPFTVYDHPKVTIFMKTDDFSPEKVIYLLEGAGFSRM